MRILALMTEAFGARGGIQEFNTHWLEALAASPGVNQVQAMVLGGDQEGNVANGVTQHQTSGGRPGYVVRAVQLARKLSSQDLIVCGHLGLAPVAWLIAAGRNIPWWLQIHGVEAWKEPGAAVRYTSEHAGLVTAVSRFTRRKYLGWSRLEPSRVKILPNTVADAFQPDAGVDAAIPGFENRKILLTVGRLSQTENYKGHDMVIAAMPELLRRFPDLVYLIVGDGGDRRRLQTQVADKGLSHAVQFLGDIPRDLLIKLYRKAAAFVMPSRGEGFGIVFLEAMACGCPVVGLGVDGSLDPLRDGLTGVVSTPEHLGADLGRVLSGELMVRPDAGVFRRSSFFDHVSALVSKKSWISR